MKYSVKKCLSTRASSQKYYPIWRKPLSSLSFYLLWILVNLGLENAYILTSGTLILGLIGSIIIYSKPVLGSLILVGSYVLDLLDGKLARLLKKENSNAKFLDWTYHSLIPGITLINLGLFLSFKSNNIICLLIGSLSALIFIHKNILSFLYLKVDEDISRNLELKNFEEKINSTYKMETYPLAMKLIYNYFLRIFIDSVDIFFGILFFAIIGYENIYLAVFFLINFMLWIKSFTDKFHQLYKKEKDLK